MNTQQLIQEKISEQDRDRLISLQEFMPKWTALKEKTGDHNTNRVEEKEHGLNYTDGSNCLIGEAHGQGVDSFYNGCPDCYFYSYGHLGDHKGTALDAKHGTVRDFYVFKEKVYNHFLESHPEMLLRK